MFLLSPSIVRGRRRAPPRHGVRSRLAATRESEKSAARRHDRRAAVAELCPRREPARTHQPSEFHGMKMSTHSLNLLAALALCAAALGASAAEKSATPAAAPAAVRSW